MFVGDYNKIYLRSQKNILVDKQKQQPNPTHFFMYKELAIKVIMNCRTTAAHIVRTRLEFKQYDVILIKVQSVLPKTKSSFEGQNMQTQYSVLVCRTDLYFHDYKLPIEIYENGHSDRKIDYGDKNINYEIKRHKQKAVEQELDCDIIRIDPDKKDFDIFESFYKIFRHIKQSHNQLTKQSTKKFW